jgi:hypothetical protein
MSSSSSDHDDSDDCLSIQLEGSDMSPTAPKVYLFVDCFKEMLTLRYADDPPREIHYETI